jgi:hypothetical protein
MGCEGKLLCWLLQSVKSNVIEEHDGGEDTILVTTNTNHNPYSKYRALRKAETIMDFIGKLLMGIVAFQGLILVAWLTMVRKEIKEEKEKIH